MQKVTIRVVMKTAATHGGGNIIAGYVASDADVGHLRSFDIDAIDPQDGTALRWVLAAPDAIPALNAEAITALCTEDCRNTALSRLSDEDVAALGLSR